MTYREEGQFLAGLPTDLQDRLVEVMGDDESMADLMGWATNLHYTMMQVKEDQETGFDCYAEDQRILILEKEIAEKKAARRARGEPSESEREYTDDDEEEKKPEEEATEAEEKKEEAPAATEEAETKKDETA